MGVFSTEKVAVLIHLDSGVLRYYTARALSLPRGSGGAVPDVAVVLAHMLEQQAKRETETSEARSLYTPAERGVLGALFVSCTVPGLWPSEGPARLTRSQLAQRTGLSALTVGQSCRALVDKGDLITRDAPHVPGRPGPAPLTYTLSTSGVERAFAELAKIDAQQASEAAYLWEERIGRHKPTETATPDQT